MTHTVNGTAFDLVNRLGYDQNVSSRLDKAMRPKPRPKQNSRTARSWAAGPLQRLTLP
jgi:hypothetical protein